MGVRHRPGTKGRNQGTDATLTDVGWGYSEKAGGDILRSGVGRSHVLDLNWSRIPAGADPLRDGALAGALADGATGLARPNSNCDCN